MLNQTSSRVYSLLFPFFSLSLFEDIISHLGSLPCVRFIHKIYIYIYKKLFKVNYTL